MKCILLFFIIITISIYPDETDLFLVTGELLPLSYQNNGELKGISMDIVKELKKRVNYDRVIEFKPWPRVIKESENDSILSFPLARFPYREDKYKWIGPILEDRFVFVSKKSNNIKIESFNDLKSFKIGVAQGAPTEKRLKDKNFKNLIIGSGESQLASMFVKNRFDVWYSSEIFIHSFLIEINYDISLLDVVYSDIDVEFYLVASLNIDDSVIEFWQNELDNMKEDGTYDDILFKYNFNSNLP